MTVFDLGGQDIIRNLWKHYYDNLDAIIFVVDSTDSNRFDDVQNELHNVLSVPENRDIPLLIWVNKRDLHSTFELYDFINQMELQ